MSAGGPALFYTVFSDVISLMFRWIRSSAAIFCIILVVLFATGAIRYLFAGLTYPFRRLSSWTQEQCTSRLRAAWEGLCDGPTRNDAAEERERLLVLLNEAQAIEQENDALRAALQWGKAQKREVLCAPIWSHGGGLGIWPRLTIGMGAQQGIRVGDAVVAPEGLVGRIDVVHSRSSEVVLISDPACRVAAEIPNVTKGITQGTAGHNFTNLDTATMLYTPTPLTLRFIPPNTPIKVGQVAYTEGSGGLFPRGIMIGTIVETRQSADGLLCEASIAPSVNSALLNVVFVLTQSSPLEEKLTDE